MSAMKSLKGDWEVLGFLTGKSEILLKKITSLEKRLLNGLKNKKLLELFKLCMGLGNYTNRYFVTW